MISEIDKVKKEASQMWKSEPIYSVMFIYTVNSCVVILAFYFTYLVYVCMTLYV